MADDKKQTGIPWDQVEKELEREAMQAEADGEPETQAADGGAKEVDPNPTGHPEVGAGPGAGQRAREGKDVGGQRPTGPADAVPSGAGGPAPGPQNLAPSHKSRLHTMRDMLATALPRIRNIIPKGFDAERLFGVAYVAIERNPKLLDCTSISVLRCVIIGAQLGLDVSGVGGQAHMVPFMNRKTGKLEATFIPGYRGLIELARRSRDVAWVYANAVYEHEQFSYAVDPIPRVFHRPLGDSSERGELVGAYALGIFRDKDVPPMPHVMTRADIDKIRSRSRAKDDGPWVTDFEAMAKKCPVRQLCDKYLPQTPELAAALDIENRAERGEAIVLPGEIELEIPAEEEKPTVEAREQQKGNDGVKVRMAKVQDKKGGKRGGKADA